MRVISQLCLRCLIGHTKQGGGRYLGARGHAGGGGYLVYFLSESTSVLLGGYLLSRTFSYKYFGT